MLHIPWYILMNIVETSLKSGDVSLKSKDQTIHYAKIGKLLSHICLKPSHEDRTSISPLVLSFDWVSCSSSVFYDNLNLMENFVIKEATFWASSSIISARNSAAIDCIASIFWIYDALCLWRSTWRFFKFSSSTVYIHEWAIQIL